MQKVPVYLYNNTVEILFDLNQNQRVNNIMYQRNISIQRGLQNKLQLQFKNSDQKLLDITSSTFVFSMFDDTDQRLLIEKPVEILDDGVTRSLRGLGLVTLTENDTLHLESVYYKFAVKQLNDSGSFEPTYANTYYTVGGTIRLLHDVEPTLKPTVTVVDFQRYFNADLQRYEWYSGNIEAHPEFKNSSAINTCAFYMSNYKGTVLIEGTLENVPGTFGNYALIDTRTYNNFSGIDYVNFTGIFTKIRVRYIPDKNPANQDNRDITYRGTFDKLLYR